METGEIDVGSFPGGLDLQATLESGQTFLWWRTDGRTYEGDAPRGDAWYVTTVRDPDGTGSDDRTPGVVRVRQTDGRLQWEATFDAAPVLHRRLRLGDDLPRIRERTATDHLRRRAYDAYWGMRIVDEPVVPTLVSFICSAQMRVERIFGMQQRLRREFGDPVTVDGETYYAYPTAATLADRSEAQLRELGLGYRAPYVGETAGLVADGSLDPEAARGMEYEDAREHLTGFVGVGDKVADCVLLFALDFLEAVPLDTWIRKAIATYYPDCATGSYADTSRAIRERLGGPVAGYAQTYLFHYLRHADEELSASASS